MRVLANGLSVAPGGGLTVAAGLLDELARLDDTTYTVLVRDGLLEDTCGQVDTINFVTMGKAGANPVVRTAWEQARLSRTMRNGRHDVYLGFGGFGMVRGSLPQVVVVQNALFYSPDRLLAPVDRSRIPVQRALQIAALRAGATGVCVSHAIREQLLPYVSTSVTLSVIPNGVKSVIANLDPEQYEPARDTVILWVGSAARHKNPMELLDALSLLSREHVESVRVRFVGALSESTRLKLERRAAGFGLAHPLTFVDRLSADEMSDEYRNATVFVSTSLVEASALPPIEAMANGTPVVLSNIGAHLEVAPQGLHYQVGAPAELARRLGGLLADSAMRRRLADEGLDQVRGRTWHAAAKAYRRELDAVVRRYGS